MKKEETALCFPNYSIMFLKILHFFNFQNENIFYEQQLLYLYEINHLVLVLKFDIGGQELPCIFWGELENNGAKTSTPTQD